MSELTNNAHRLLRLFEQMREAKPSSALKRMQELGLSFSHIRAMHVLIPDRTLAMKELADALDLTPPSVTALTRRLVQTGLVRREADTSDSRVSLLSLTEDGRALMHDMYQHQVWSMERLLAGLSDDEQEQFLGLMERAVRALRASDN